MTDQKLVTHLEGDERRKQIEVERADIWIPGTPCYQLPRYVLYLTGRSPIEIEASELAAISTIYGWGVGPSSVVVYMESRSLHSFKALVDAFEPR